jgi:predicted metal-dependent phosphoesterase TrpH
MPVYRVDFHHHVDTDPEDVIGYSAAQLAAAARGHGLDAIAITPHDGLFHDPGAVEAAARIGVLLIPGIEKKIGGREVLILNVRPGEVPQGLSFDDLRRMKVSLGDRILTVAPHPFYPLRTSLGRALDEVGDCIDAMEVAHLHGFGIDPNARAERWAMARGKPLLANSDTHDLAQLGRNFTEVEADDLDTCSLFRAIRAGRCRARTAPISFLGLVRFAFGVVLYQTVARLALRDGRRIDRIIS